MNLFPCNGDERLTAEWQTCLRVMREARARGIDFAVGGGFAVASYTSHRQSTKDLDLYVLPDDRERMIELLSDCGFADYYPVASYDRHWIYRSYRDGIIVDIIWGMPNRRAEVDAQWLSRGPETDLHGQTVRVLPPEELIWAKLYVMQRDRCDWPDVLNLVDATAGTLEWDYLVERLGDDAPLLAALLTIYGWLRPDKAPQLPVFVEILARPSNRRPDAIPREDLLDTRPWFAPDCERVEAKDSSC